MRVSTAAIVLLGTLAGPVLAGQAWADTHTLTVVNSGIDTIRRIDMSVPGGAGDNRLRSQLPPGATARITYSTGCRADVRLGYDGGRTEAFPDVDVCSDPRIVTGAGVLGGAGAGATPTTDGSNPKPRPAATKHATPVANATPLAPPPVVPPWTGKSITKRFGGMD